MGYDYYQQHARLGWGTNQYQFGPPPQPAFQPQPSWGGNDFYRAHAATADPYLFDHAWNRVREYGGAPAGGMGVNLQEARLWHKRAYLQNELHTLAPNEIGHAAAYEAYRTWIHNSYLYEPLSGDVERQREALTGLSVAEATRLLQYLPRPVDEYSRLAATEAAAHTASYIFYQTRDDDYRSRSRYRYGDYGDDLYAQDDNLLRTRGRSYSRHGHRSHSRHRSYSQSGIAPFPGQAYSSTSMTNVPHTVFPGYGDSYDSYSGNHGSMGHMPVPSLHGSSYHPNGVPIGSGSAYGGSAYGGSTMGINTPYSSVPTGVASSYHGSSVNVPTGYSRSRSSSFSYPQTYGGTTMSVPMGTPMNSSGMGMPMAMSASGMGVPMPMSASGMSPMGMQPAQTIVIHKSRKHKHRHHSHKRSRSSDGDYYD
ncbi:hypothetical protein JR316_0002179 [Psilocybe cubensis]|uniref:Uncharacterized protein n=1 Tax=Psilocybe cubensis TaxID=181762 RepID=A0ACB8HC98_PSICU|nr:hypothetical protein JR316_0002179 [Psilocybe cubensis]KAH9485272.1 hypothetical protein JR316_0002179 [Psilocybe cubensis]